MDLMPRLRHAADAWVAAHRDEAITLKTLGVRAVANSKLFERDDMNVSTYQRVVAFLGDPDNWPAGLVPRETAGQLVLLGVTVPHELTYAVAA